ncbi:unnamed protein product [Rhizoctonia solani]|uniref:Transmembrane protein n=1 Tax=Rhizoctonia solani TaxID=456999 RepID=A0A8H3E6N6_9AGAM|nr:unnamed protein product [Rhizoctonia solani]
MVTQVIMPLLIRPRIITWQYWISFLQLITGLYGIAYCAWMVEYYPRRPGDSFETYMLLSLLRPWDTFDGIGNLTIYLTALELVRYGLYSYISARHHPKAILLGVSLPLAELCSLSLLSIYLRPIFMLRSEFSVKDLLKANTKDIFTVTPTLTTCSEDLTLGIFGCPRAIATPHPSPRDVYTAFLLVWARILKANPWIGFIYMLMCKIGLRIVTFFTHLFFRRVSPVESRAYALFRNTFAVASIGILIFRTATAFQQAQNQFGTRMTSANCGGRASSNHTLGILLERHRGASINVTLTTLNNYAWDRPIQESQSDYGNSYSRLLFVSSSEGGSSSRPLELWTCNKQSGASLPNIAKPGVLVDGIYIAINSISPGAALAPEEMPLIWLLNLAELPHNGNLSSLIDVRTYMPPWRLRRGFHIEAEAKLITRRFITSSIVKDIVLSTQPVYRPLSLYPIVESSTSTLNTSAENIGPEGTGRATAALHTTLNPGIMYFRSQTDQRFLDSTARGESCDFIEDYRMGTVFDVIGSVGGLFALLHAAHVLLFGRPLLWGLTGAKLINPFGLLGACSSRGFRRRLRDYYHRRSPEDGLDTIRVDAFLRDFVIEFGPADLNREHRLIQQPSTPPPNSLKNEEEAVEVRIPLMQAESSETILLQKDEAKLDTRQNGD